MIKHIKTLIEDLKVELVEMSDLRPSQSGTGHVIHLFRCTDRKVGHAARAKVFPRKPSERMETTLMVPRKGEPEVVGEPISFKDKITGKGRKLVLKFAKQNQAVIWRFWADLDYSTEEMFRDVVPVK